MTWAMQRAIDIVRRNRGMIEVRWNKFVQHYLVRNWVQGAWHRNTLAKEAMERTRARFARGDIPQCFAGDPRDEGAMMAWIYDEEGGRPMTMRETFKMEYQSLREERGHAIGKAEADAGWDASM